MRTVVAGIFFTLVMVPLGAFAQVGGVGSGGLSIELSPPTPGPYTGVTATMNDYSVSAFGADIRWYVNGELQSAASDQRTFTFTTGDIGETTQLRLDLITNDDTTYTATRVITPARIDIIIEPQTFVPGFYTGSALPSVGSLVRLTALVFSDGDPTPGDLVYNWRFNNSSVAGGPMVGRDRIEVEVPFTPDPTLTVSVSRRDGTLIGTKHMTIPTVEPEVVFYPVSTLNDIGHIAISSPYQISGGDLTVRAQPYHLSSDTLLRPDTVSWHLNNRPLTFETDNAYELTLGRVIGERAGRLEIEVKDPVNIIQRTQGSFTFSN